MLPHLQTTLSLSLERMFETHCESWIRRRRELVKTAAEVAALAAIRMGFDRRYHS